MAAGQDEAAPASENPIDAHNHALAALRYLVSRLDKHKQIIEPRTIAPDAPAGKRDDDDERWWPSTG